MGDEIGEHRMCHHREIPMVLKLTDFVAYFLIQIFEFCKVAFEALGFALEDLFSNKRLKQLAAEEKALRGREALVEANLVIANNALQEIRARHAASIEKSETLTKDGFLPTSNRDLFLQEMTTQFDLLRAMDAAIDNIMCLEREKFEIFKEQNRIHIARLDA